MLSTEIHASPAIPAVKSMHLALVLGHPRHVSLLVQGLPKALAKAAIFDPKKAENRADIEAIGHMAFQTESEGFEVFVLPLASIDIDRFNAISRIFNGNFSFFEIRTDVDEFVRRHPMSPTERRSFEADVKAFEERYHAVIESLRKVHGPKHYFVRGSRRECAQIEYMAHHIDRQRGRIGRALS